MDVLRFRSTAHELEEKNIPLTAEEAVDRAGLGDLETLHLMETAGLDLPAARNEAGDSALLSAVRSDNADSIAYLVERGHEIDITDAEGETPLLIAVVATLHVARRGAFVPGVEVLRETDIRFHYPPVYVCDRLYINRRVSLACYVGGFTPTERWVSP